jgi:vitamin B12 transporter
MSPSLIPSLCLRRSLLTASVLLALPAAAHAAGESTLPDVVVTATRTETPRRDVLAAVTVLEREDIERSQAPDLIDLLGRQPGIDIVRTGGPGSLSTFNTRGGNSNHTLILIDGLRVNSSVQGLFDLAHLPLAQVERIEIVRGPRAALWGSDAIGGVVQVFTRAAGGFFEARVGSYGERAADAGVRLGTAERHVALAAGAESFEGFSASTSPLSADDDGYRNRHAIARFRTELGNQVLSGALRGSAAHVEFDDGESDIDDWQAGVGLAGDLRPGWGHELLLGRSHDTVDTASPFFEFGFASTRDSLDWLHRFAPAAGQVLQVGLNWSREQGRADDSFLGENYDLDRRNTGLFAAWTGHFAAHTLEASARHDDNSQFGGTSTGNVAWGWQANATTRVRASWGQGFRAPNFNELYYPGFFGSFAGNPDLAPERSTSVEAGLDWAPGGRHELGLSAYRTRVRQMIVFEAPLTNNAINIDRAHLDGVELDWRWAAGPWSLAANAGWQRAENGRTGQALLRRAPRKAHASVDYRFGNGATLGLDADAVAARPDLDFSTFPAQRIALGGYGLLHLRAALPLGRGWRLEARVENLADRDYTLAQGYNTPGRSGALAVRWQPSE